METVIKQLLIRLASTAPSRWLGRKLAGRFLPIFLLHRVVDDQGHPDHQRLDILRQQLQYIRDRRYRPLRLIDACHILQQGEPLPELSVVFTVDDGFFDHAEILGPLFAEYDIPFTCFVLTDFLDRRLWPWDNQLSHALAASDKPQFDIPLPGEQRDSFRFIRDSPFKPQLRALRQRLKSLDQTCIYTWLDQLYQVAGLERPADIPTAFRPMSWGQAKALIDMGHDIAPHTHSHRILSRLNDEEAEEEILGSLKVIQHRLPDSVPLFAYPTGGNQDFTPRDQDIVARSSLLAAVSTIPLAVHPGADLTALPRYGMPYNMPDFMQYIDWIEVVKNRLRRL